MWHLFTHAKGFHGQPYSHLHSNITSPYIWCGKLGLVTMAFFHILSIARWSVPGGEFHMVLLQWLTPIIGTNPVTYVLCLAVN